jgi:hypothetical protein
MSRSPSTAIMWFPPLEFLCYGLSVSRHHLASLLQTKSEFDLVFSTTTKTNSTYPFIMSATVDLDYDIVFYEHVEQVCPLFILPDLPILRYPRAVKGLLIFTCACYDNNMELIGKELHYRRISNIIGQTAPLDLPTLIVCLGNNAQPATLYDVLGDKETRYQGEFIYGNLKDVEDVQSKIKFYINKLKNS